MSVKVTKAFYGSAPVGTETYVGAVLRTYSETVRIMSDVWADGYFAEVWDETEGRVRAVGIGNSEFGSDLTATPDATPEVWAKARAYWVATEAARLEADWDARADRAAADANRIAKGKVGRVFKGRKVKKGTTGDIIWTGDGHYGPRVGLKDADGTVHFTAASNVEVLDGADHFDWEYWVGGKPSPEEFARRATAAVAERLRNKYNGYPVAGREAA